MAQITPPPNSAVDQNGGTILVSWATFFTNVYNICSALTQSGTTAQRPTKFLWVGRMYYDTTLGFPVWVNSVNPVVWHRANGAVA